MPLITPPSLSEPVIEEEPYPTISYSRAEEIKRYMDVPNWVCPNCRLTNFGHNKHCADLKCRFVPCSK